MPGPGAVVSDKGYLVGVAWANKVDELSGYDGLREIVRHGILRSWQGPSPDTYKLEFLRGLKAGFVERALEILSRSTA